MGSRQAMDLFADVRWHASKVLERVRMHGEDRPDALDVARALAIRVIMVSRRVLDVPVASVTPQGRAMIRVWKDLAYEVIQYLVAHAIGQWTLVRKKLVRSAEAPWCGGFAGGLLAPSRALRAQWRQSSDLLRFCRSFPNIPETCALMAAAEERLANVLVYQGDALRYTRGLEVPPPQAVEAANRARDCGAFERGPVRALRLTDVPERVVVVIAA